MAKTQSELESLFSKVIMKDISFDGMSEKEIWRYKRLIGIRKFMERINIGKYSNFFCIFRKNTRIIPINEFANILWELGITDSTDESFKIIDELDDGKVSRTLCSPDYLKFDKVTMEGRNCMRVQMVSWD